MSGQIARSTRAAVAATGLWLAAAGTGTTACAGVGVPPPDPRDVFVVSPSPGFRWPSERLVFEARERDRCLECHGMPTFLVRDSLTRAIRDLGVDGAAFLASVHSKLACTDCHGEIRNWPHAWSTPRAPVGCDADCHARDPEGRAVRHTTAMAEQRRSVHAPGLGPGRPASPGCTGCHGGDAHATPPAKRGRSRADLVAQCAPCHDDRETMIDRRVHPGAVASWRQSYHARALRFGSTRSAVCQDCHGAHLVLAATDTASTVSAGHLPATCGQQDCHRGAGPGFALSGANHLALRVPGEPVLRAAELLFGRVGLGVVILLGIGVLLDARRRLAPPLREARLPRRPLVPRLSMAMRLQHAGLVVSFVLLTLTGLPLRFPDAEGLGTLYGALGGWSGARTMHRAAAALMMAVAVIHLGYALVLLVRSRFDIARAWPMLPGAGDVREWWETSLWYLDRRAAPPPGGRHHFREKLHYLAVAWGVPVMSLSGLLLWFPVALGNLLPDVAVAIAHLAHRDEALIAIAVVILWHLYQVVVVPGPHFRMLTVFDGRITAAEWIRLHPLEARPPGSDPGAAGAERRR